MNKERTAGLIFEGEITDEQIKKIPKDFGGEIFLKGSVIGNYNTSYQIPGSVWLDGYFKAKYLKVEGDLILESEAMLKIKDGLDVSGNVILKENSYIETTDINVGGDIEGVGRIDSGNINVYGTFSFKGEIALYGNKIYAGKLDIDAVIDDCGGIKSGW